ncbi:HEXXH motif-containing putative peptide modification protein [Streptomyces sp. B1866]|uniref:aKG-HExxH-type peptide beta-hydroxylase n=1 Tax=Streptomyces sp. B1866 TaxID=3075431 RepID=UPI0028906921|nr:HEXXH motif-containing putative peptide modification protein [Streptomyces sp. B1866]MDT3399614.1 HEXXH motif-containing putative peptide modification protein [Streptomyces sp. B1866]
MIKSLSLCLGGEDLLWFPGLTAELVAEFISRNQVEPSLVEQYGTSRWLAGNARPPVPDGGDIRVGPHVAKIEYLSRETAAGFEGLHFADSRDPQIRGRIQAAADVLTHVPNMTESIGSVVKAIHPLQAPRDHDVSHSTPELPFSIFVSIPEKDERDASLRVAESIIHESMHLQLTLVDSIEPLAVDDRASGYSPWKDEVRPVTGLLHGLYVFAVIHQALGILTDVRGEWCQYCRKRSSAIEHEIASLSEVPEGLSKMGINLWRRCLESIAA